MQKIAAIIAMILSTTAHAATPVNFGFRIQPSTHVHVERFSGDSAVPSSRAIIMFHGFPAYSSKNEEIARQLSTILHADVYLMHYRGLGKSSGLFSFEGAVSDGVDLIKGVQALGYSSVALLGHSFGGAVALSVTHEILSASPASPAPSPQSLILLSPLSQFPGADEIHKDLSGFVQHEASLGHEYSLQILEDDALRFQRGYAPTQFADALETAGIRLLVVHASKDTVIKPDVTRAWTKSLAKPPTYLETDDDHWFSHTQPALGAEIAQWLAKSAPKE